MAFHRQLWNAFALLLLTGITSYYIHNGVRMTGSKVVEIAEEKVPELSKHDKSSLEPSNTPSPELPKHDKSSLQPSKNDKASIQTITHFFSHIPKAGGQYAWQEILRLFQSTVVYPNNRTKDDIRYAHQRFNQYYKNSTNGSDFLISTGDENWNNFPVDLEGATDAYTPSKLCQWGLAPLNKIKPYQTDRNSCEVQRCGNGAAVARRYRECVRDCPRTTIPRSVAILPLHWIQQPQQKCVNRRPRNQCPRSYAVSGQVAPNLHRSLWSIIIH